MSSATEAPASRSVPFPWATAPDPGATSGAGCVEQPGVRPCCPSTTPTPCARSTEVGTAQRPRAREPRSTTHRQGGHHGDREDAVTTTLTRPDTPGDPPDHGVAEWTHGSTCSRSPMSSAGVSDFTADTWVFFGPPPVDGAMADRWGLGFGPTGGELPRWSLFHTVGPDRFDEHVECPYPAPLDPVLLRWSTSVVGRRTAARLLGSVGACLDFYRQYFAERPDLGVPVGPWARGLRPSAIPPIRSLVSSSDPYEANE